MSNTELKWAVASRLNKILITQIVIDNHCTSWSAMYIDFGENGSNWLNCEPSNPNLATADEHKQKAQKAFDEHKQTNFWRTQTKSYI